MSKGKKIALGVLIVLVAVIVGLAVLIPMLINIDRYRPQVIAHIQEATGKPAEIGKLALTIFPTLSIRVDDFALGNPPGFPQGYLVKTRRIYAVVDRGALWNRQVIIKSIELDQPVIRLLSDVRGRWNFENPTAPKQTSSPADNSPSSFTLGVVDRVSLKDGDLATANLLASGKPGPDFFAARGVSLDLADVDISAFIASNSASLVPKPEAVRPPTGRAFGATVLYAAPAQGKPAAQGTLRADVLRFGTLQATSVRTKLRLFPKQVFFDDLNFGFYGGRASGSLSFNFAGRNPAYSTNARLSGVDVGKMLEAFPDARGKLTGTMDGTMKLAGEVTHSPDPLAGMRGTGQLSIKDGKLPSLQLNRNLMMLARFSQLGAAEGDPSSFQSMSADLNIAAGKIRSDKITIVGNGVDVDGSGVLTLAGEGSLDYEGIAKLAAGQNPITNILGGLSGATYADGKLTFPFSVGGTFENPQFKLKSLGSKQQLTGLQGLLGAKGQQQAGAQGQQQQTPADLVQGIAGMFKKKQSTQQQTQPK